jgi:ABC-2 type transport system ATP-binding protein
LSAPEIAATKTDVRLDEGGSAVHVSGLTKVYAKGVKAVDSVSFEVRTGEVFGLLGPNGAGKTTIIKMIMTLTSPTSGEVTVNGVDAFRRPAAVRQMLGYVPQDVSVDGDLTAYENLLISAKLYFVDKKDRQERIGAALRLMGLEERKDDMVKTFSGGMMRRLEIAQALVNRPRVLFLDEPSIGLDPAAKHEVWKHVKRLNREFETTIFITTHDMTEADELCDRIAVMNAGRFVVTGTPSELKGMVGGEMVTVKVRQGPGSGTGLENVVLPDELGATVMSGGGAGSGGLDLAIVVKRRAEEAIPGVARAFEEAGVEVDSISVSRPTLDDVFLKFTQTRIGEAEYRQTRSARRSFRKHSK